MAKGAIYVGAGIPVQAAAATILSGDPIVVGGLNGYASIDAFLGDDGEYQTVLDILQAHPSPVAGTLGLGVPVYVASGSAAGNEAVEVTLTATAGTDGKRLFGHVVALSQTSGSAFVLPVQGNGKGPSA